MDNIQGKHFSITDPEGVKTVIYQVNKTEKEFLKDFRNTSNDEEYFSYINNLSNIEKYQIEKYFKKRLNTLKSGV